MIKNITKYLLIFFVMMSIILCFIGCRQADRVSYNISKEADYFNVTRRILVINARTDKVLLEVIGKFALKNNDSNELTVIVESEDGSYQKHFIYLNEYTIYVVEDLSNSKVHNNAYEFNVLPLIGPQVVPDWTD